MKNLNEVLNDLKQHYGTSQYYAGLCSSSVYTDGAKDLFEQTNSFWLYDIIQSELVDLLFKRDVLDTYYLKISVPENITSMEMQLQDYQNRVIWSKHIGFTDFPSGELMLIVGYDGEHLITCLPSER